ncbi:hypothetical protein D9758_009916 [Tetrapyrgos nigripes]|uniref:Xylanolytic transcriptional activator regulatory domain-containing protein n=1 Tax=Tetrapyrgos nigripes TaxID=182062 RepID=A0A8H5CQH6_9AGAR|nr:hypothetical protein D9758_009916 [Tetrapyrgos nigripes]
MLVGRSEELRMLAMNVVGEKFDAIVRLCQTGSAAVASLGIQRVPIRWQRDNTSNFAAVKSIISSILAEASQPFNIPEDEDSVREILVDIATYVRHLEKELARARRHESWAQHQTSRSTVDAQSTPQSGPSPSSVEEESDYSEGEALSHEIAKVRLTRMQNRHFGKSSSVFLITSAIDIMKYPYYERRWEYYVPSQFERTYVEGKPVYEFPEHDHLQSLVEVYFTHHHPHVPLLHQASFERSVAEGLHLRDHQFGALVLAVCSVASKYSVDSRNLPEDSSVTLALGWRWFQQLKLTRNMFAEPVSLYELQTFCLEISFLRTSFHNEASWLLTGLCIRLAHERGLHRRRDPLEKPTLERELWKRAFWFLSMNDTLWSAFFGRPCASSKDEYDLEPLVEYDDSVWGSPFIDVSTLSTSKTSNSAYWNCLIKLVEILAFCQRTLYSVRKSELIDAMGVPDTQWNEKAATQIDSALNSWTDALPSHLKWDPHCTNTVYIVQSASLHAVFYWIQLHAHRSFIPLLKQGGQLSSTFPSVAICMNAARSCINIIDVLHRRHGHAMLSELPVALMSSAVIIMICIFRSKELQLQIEPQKEMATVFKSVGIMRDWEKTYMTAGRFVDLMHVIMSGGGLQYPIHVQETPESALLKRPREMDPERNPQSTMDPPTNPSRTDTPPEIGRLLAGSNRVPQTIQNPNQHLNFLSESRTPYPATASGFEETSAFQDQRRGMTNSGSSADILTSVSNIASSTTESLDMDAAFFNDLSNGFNSVSNVLGSSPDDWTPALYGTVASDVGGVHQVRDESLDIGSSELQHVVHEEIRPQPINQSLSTFSSGGDLHMMTSSSIGTHQEDWEGFMANIDYFLEYGFTF